MRKTKKIPLKLCTQLGVSRMTINNWNRGIWTCPLQKACEIQDLTKGAIRVCDIRPDIKGVIPYIMREVAEYIKKTTT